MNVMSLSYSYLPLFLIYKVQFQKVTHRYTRSCLVAFSASSKAYDNLISNNCRKTAVMKKYELQTKFAPLRILLKKIEGVLCARRPVRKSREKLQTNI